MLDYMDLKKRTHDMSDRELLETLAERVYDICAVCENHTKRINRLEKWHLLVSGAISTITASVTAYLWRYRGQ